MIKPISFDEIPIQGKKGNKLKEEIESFIQTEEPYGEVELGKRAASSVAASIKIYINRYNYPIRCSQKCGRVFVIRTDI